MSAKFTTCTTPCPSPTKFRALTFFLTAVLFLFGPLAAVAQTSLGGINGEVSDAQHALVGGATVTATSLDTEKVFSTKTTKAGAYEFPALDSGEYRLAVKAKGFEESVIESIQVDAGVTASANIRLKIGSENTVVEVTAKGLDLDQTSATINAVVDKEVVVELPYPERSALELATLAPGVNGDPQYTGGVQSEDPGVTTQPNTPGASIAIAGGRPGSASQLVDGFDITLSGYPRAGVTFSKDTISSITVQQGFLQAQYGRNGGGIINQSTRAGAEQYHGRFYYRHYDPFLEARTQGIASPPDAHQNLFTAMVSGPVPGTKRSKTFFLFAYEPLRASNKQYTRRRVATPDELLGHFHNSSDLLNGTILKTQGYAAAVAAPRVNGIYDQFPLTAQGFPLGARLKTPYPEFPNDDISMQVTNNPVAQYLNSLQPSANDSFLNFLGPTGDEYDQAGNNAIGVRAVTNRDDRYNARIDHELNQRNTMFVRYTVVPVNGLRYDYMGPTSIGDQIPTDTIISRNLAMGLTSVVGSNKVNEARASYLRSNRYRGPAVQTLNKDYGAAIGLSHAVAGVGFPTFSFSNNLSSIGSGGTETDGGRSLDINFGLGDDFSWQVGRHSIKFGLDYRALQLNRTDDSGTHGGQYGFNAALVGSTVTSAPNAACGAGGCISASGIGIGNGSTLAAFDLGLISSLTIRQAYPFYTAGSTAQPTFRTTGVRSRTSPSTSVCAIA